MNISYRFYEIDFLRFFAALSIVFFHYTFKGYAEGNTVLDFPHLGEISRYGYLGFNLFFMISGFVILLSAYKKKGSEFVLARIVRLYPAYWFSVTVTFLTILIIGGSRYDADLPQYIVNLTMMHDYIGVSSIDGVYWTLMVELRFYFLIFIIISINQINNIKYYLGAWLALTIALIVYHNRYIGFFLFPQWSSYFIAGACFYLIYRDGLSFYTLFVVGISYLISVYNAVMFLPKLGTLYNVELSSFLILSITSLFYIIFMTISLKKTRSLNKKRFMSLGVLTYPIYLIHQNVGFMLFNLLNEYLNKYVILVLVVFIMLIMAYLIHVYIEKKYSNYFSKNLYWLRNRMLSLL